jgi:hypothetical protein
MFHYLSVKRIANRLAVTSHFLKNDFSGFDTGISFNTDVSGSNIAATNDVLLNKNNR